ncbi:hypothetical protein J6TS1_01440 [Siminovitchia terrae]|uniref:Uncharacterized protein n=1 Tax=Siminovitchia terrae TaxID=1914933 RepID=A0ABQ4KRL0_SIMTE|nr:hypothetical protein J6TS1_01440 [Siminovitchia terrae]
MPEPHYVILQKGHIVEERISEVKMRKTNGYKKFYYWYYRHSFYARHGKNDCCGLSIKKAVLGAGNSNDSIYKTCLFRKFLGQCVGEERLYCVVINFIQQKSPTSVSREGIPFSVVSNPG